MDFLMRESFFKAFRTELVTRNGQIKLNIQDNMKKEKNVGKVGYNGPIKLNQIKKGIKSLKISFLKFMKDPFKIINFMEKVFTLGQMDEIIMENGFKEK